MCFGSPIHINQVFSFSYSHHSIISSSNLIQMNDWCILNFQISTSTWLHAKKKKKKVNQEKWYGEVIKRGVDAAQ